MTIVDAKYTYIDGEFQTDRAVIFSKQIEDIDSIDVLKTKYPDANIIETKENSILYPGFINTHVHLEFSANRTTLKYGDFMRWLDSVITNREELIGLCDQNIILKACDEMLQSGVTTFGAVSSFGMDLESCAKTPQKVIFFNELIGSNMGYADALYNDFLARLEESKRVGNGVSPAVAIHSPYSVYPTILKRAVKLAEDENLPISAHLLESPAEREWLENLSGDFLGFFKKYFNSSKPVNDIWGFLKSFDNVPTHFIHATQIENGELEYIAKRGHSIAHCPRSNRLLGCGRLPIENLKDIPFSVATDGLSSNSSLNIFDELRSALMMHHTMPLDTLSRLLINAVTSNPAKIFGLNRGEIAKGRDADLVLIGLPHLPSSTDDIALQTILHTRRVDGVFIDGSYYEV